MGVLMWVAKKLHQLRYWVASRWGQARGGWGGSLREVAQRGVRVGRWLDWYGYGDMARRGQGVGEFGLGPREERQVRVGSTWGEGSAD